MRFAKHWLLTGTVATVTALTSIGNTAVAGGQPPAATADQRAGVATPSASKDPDADWSRRSRAQGVVIAEGFDDIRDWVKYGWDRSNCNPSYQVSVDGKKAGCRSNAWDSTVHSSGKGSVRFDILSQSNQGGAGNMAIPFGDYETSQFGANSEFWVSWRQKIEARVLQGYKAQVSGSANFKQVIIGQGDMPIGAGGKMFPANACSEAQIVIVSSNPGARPSYPIGYIECGRYLAFEQLLKPGTFAGEARGSAVITRQNMRTNEGGLANCIAHPDAMDQSGCHTYLPDQWTTYMVHMKLGPEGRAAGSVSRLEQPGYINSTYELYAAHDGEDFQLLHHQEGVVIPKGQYYLGGDPMVSSSYKAGWGPGDGHPQARYGKLWLLPYMTNKDTSEVSAKTSTWYDEIIVSRCKIAAPGYPAPRECNPPSAMKPIALVTPAPPHQSAAKSLPAPTSTPIAAGSLARPSQIPPPGPAIPKTVDSALSAPKLMAAIHALKPGHWLEIPGSEMVRVQVDACKSTAVTNAYERIGTGAAGCNPDGIMAYSGGVYDTRRHRLIVWGGGHSAYAGNELYAFDVVGSRWMRLTDPSPPLLEYEFDKNAKKSIPVSPPWHDTNYPPAPVSVHSYDQMEYLPEQSLLFSAGGSTFSGSGYATALTWLFDLAKSDTSGWSQAEPMPKDKGLYEYNMSTAYDPVSKKVIMRGYVRGGTFDPVAKSWKVGNATLPTRKIGTVGELDPKRRKLVLIGQGSAEQYAVSSTGELGPPEPLAATGDKEIEQCYAPGFVYDAKADRLVAWCAKGDVYSLDLERRVWTRHSAKSDVVPGDPGNTPQIRGTFGRFRYMPEYNAYIVVNGTRQNVFVYRLADDKGTLPQ